MDKKIKSFPVAISNDMKSASVVEGSSVSRALYDHLREYISIVSAFRFLTKEEEHSLAIAASNGDLGAAEELVKSHLRLVVKIALEYRRYGLVIMDLVSEGNMGLMHAVKKFDPGNGTRLATYAIWWIRAAIKRFIIKSWSVVKFGTTNEERSLFFGLNKAKEHLGIVGVSSASESEVSRIAEYTNASAKAVKRVEERLFGSDASMSAILHTGLSREDVLFSTEKNPEEEVSRKIDGEIMRSRLSGAFAKLSEKEKFILSAKMRTGEKHTLKSLGDQLNVSGERARQILESAKAKIKDFMLNYVPNERLV